MGRKICGGLVLLGRVEAAVGQVYSGKLRAEGVPVPCSCLTSDHQTFSYLFQRLIKDCGEIVTSRCIPVGENPFLRALVMLHLHVLVMT